MTEIKAGFISRYRWVLCISILTAIPLGWMGVDWAFGQAPDLPDLYRTKGKIIAEGKNSNPTGQYQVKTYRIEEIHLPKLVRATVNGRDLEVDRAFTVTLTGGPFPLRALPPIIWIDDTPIKWAQHSEDLSELTAVTFDRGLLKEGAKISFSFGEGDISYTTLPEKLSFKKGGDQR